MSVGLIALLDDIAGMAKVAAASVGDIAGRAAKAGAKTAGVVIDDAAVTPRYVVGFGEACRSAHRARWPEGGSRSPAAPQAHRKPGLVTMGFFIG